MMTCEEARTIFDGWEHGTPSQGSPRTAASRSTDESGNSCLELRPCDAEALKAHCASCPDCDEQFGPLLPLIERDAAGADTDLVVTPNFAGTSDQAQASILFHAQARADRLADAVMTAIDRQRKPFVSFGPMLAIAATLIFAVGLGLGIFFTRLNSDKITVAFVLDAPDASSVYLAGDFNRWSGEGYALRKTGRDGKWEIKIPLERGRVYVYNFVINGTEWIADPAAEVRVDDGFGGSGSLLRL